MEEGTILQFVIKEAGKCDGQAIVGINIDGFTKLSEGESTVYRGYVDTTGDEIKTALKVDDSDTNDIAILDSHAELLWSKDGRKQRPEIINAYISNLLKRMPCQMH